MNCENCVSFKTEKNKCVRWGTDTTPDNTCHEFAEDNRLRVVLDEGAIMPTRAYSTDAGLDIYAPYDVNIPGSWKGIEAASLGSVVVDTGVHIEIPVGFVGMVKSKSGLNFKKDLITEGVVDAGYTGSIRLKIYNMGWRPQTIKKGEKLTQLVIMPIITPDLKLVDKLEDSERGNGGFGSTGK